MDNDDRIDERHNDNEYNIYEGCRCTALNANRAAEAGAILPAGVLYYAQK